MRRSFGRHSLAAYEETLFDIYECAINRELERYGFAPDDPADVYKATFSGVLKEALEAAGVDYECQNESSPQAVDWMKREILEAVKRWHQHDWLAIENKLRTSIVEG
ncbi:MAG TPA: hypothetical protein VMG63_08895, partial [Terriglobia bacterium]|nr:hypothetical protein [Terriglobia bacterium]